MLFSEFLTDPDLLDALEIRGFTEATPIQEAACPLIIEGHDLIACAQTGTGKTGAYLLPVLDLITEGEYKNKGLCLILAPTRELAKQIDEQISGFGYYSGITSIAIYGGGSGDDWGQQKTALSEGANIVVATPGRLISHLKLGYVDFSKVEFFILDEADKMLDMGFYDDIRKIESYLPKKKQSLLFSATMPDQIRKLANTILLEPKQISMAVSLPAEGITQLAYLAHDAQKTDLLLHLIEKEDIQSMIVFVARKSNVDKIVKALKKKGLEAEGIHSDKDQRERERLLNDFTNHKLRIVVATDILSRGIDVDDISHVVNYDVPKDPEDYIHRIGRTARYESTGIGITFINQDDFRSFQRIEKLIKRPITKEENPDYIGPGPRWDSSSHKKGGGKKKHGNKHSKPRNDSPKNENQAPKVKKKITIKKKGQEARTLNTD